MNDFDYDCKTKKTIAGNARYKHPSRPTWQNNRKEEPGECVTVNLNEFIPLADYLKLSPDLQTEWCRLAAVNHNLNPVALAELWHCSIPTARKYSRFPEGRRRMSEAEKRECIRWVTERVTERYKTEKHTQFHPVMIQATIVGLDDYTDVMVILQRIAEETESTYTVTYGGCR